MRMKRWRHAAAKWDGRGIDHLGVPLYCGLDWPPVKTGRRSRSRRMGLKPTHPMGFRPLNRAKRKLVLQSVGSGESDDSRVCKGSGGRFWFGRDDGLVDWHIRHDEVERPEVVPVQMAVE